MKYFVKVIPSAKIERIQVDKAAGEEIKVWTRAKAVDGAANAALVKALSEFFKVPKSGIKILRGEMSRHKVVEIYGAD